MAEQYYELHIAGLTRQLPVMPISEDTAIAGFVILGDTEIVTAVAPELNAKLPPCDLLVTAEAKGIPLVAEMARLLGHKRYVVARKSMKLYMEDPLIVDVDSITTAAHQKLYLDGKDAARMKGRRVAIIDDVISTGESLKALEDLVNTAGGQIVAKAAILAEGEAIDRQDIVYLEPLPLIPLT
ncbi:MAG: phosphoribosyltransferase family protein [Oscillospiraceae bacterium]|nr:phosphoribosyltransferase family protein [Oscillospiraceae bacterium]MDD4368929.1 phosphoribosyltransferase family protein [Oscillospiraceae bacterium]